MRYVWAALLTALLAGCNERPPADLRLDLIDGDTNEFDVLFSSDVNILDLYAGSSFRTNISTNLICSLSSAPNFDSENDHRNIAGGVVEPLAVDRRDSAYKFRASLLFIDPEHSTRETSKILNAAGIEAALANHVQMTCKVRVLAYLTPPYFTKALVIPTEKLREVIRRPDR